MLEKFHDLSFYTLSLGDTEFIHQHISHSQLRYIEGAGHSSSIEEPEQVNQCIQEFLNHILQYPEPV